MSDLEPTPLRLEVTPEGVALIIIDSEGDSVNTLKADFALRLSELLDRLDDTPSVNAVVFTSACLLYTSPSPRDS